MYFSKYTQRAILYIQQNPDHYVSWGTFNTLKPFYVRTATSKDVEMCCCKLHLHARWSVKALVSCCMNNNIDIGNINNYDTFFSTLTEGCESDPNTYIDWRCTPDKKTTCQGISNKWIALKENILADDSRNETVPFTHFVTKPHKTKKGKEIMRLESDTINVNLEFIVKFMDLLLPNIIHHRNQLCNYRNTIHTFSNLFDSISIDIDFSEKLKVPLKYEPQSMHWTGVEVIVHSGILKNHGEKEYHSYVRRFDSGSCVCRYHSQ